MIYYTHVYVYVYTHKVYIYIHMHTHGDCGGGSRELGAVQRLKSRHHELVYMRVSVYTYHV